ncbi:hypothetical protein GYA37_00110 [candidate division WWE3 bacterium]|uniref:Peptidase S24/S26A/S26B/S26C domain-containing protein n=1 Tax=candidate division WWE3 bacterium TaxID=2053526 RepID=A0A7X9HTB8_UNCKA|nr:hypothetical protein [candidate division WWE3 bacterium]
MHETQKKILQLSSSYNLSNLKLREIGKLIGSPHPQVVKHHLEQLKKKGFLKVEPTSGDISAVKPGEISSKRLVSIPILGNANCGEATMFAEEQLSGYLKISTSILLQNLLAKTKSLFAVKAYGESMNRSSIATNMGMTKNIEEGDYVIVDTAVGSPKTGDYVLSVIDGSANIKKFVNDTRNNQVALISESSLDLPPIYIDSSMNYLINGKVVQVIKAPKYK